MTSQIIPCSCSWVDNSSNYEVDKSKTVVVNPMYPPSIPSNPTTPSSVNTSNNSYSPSYTLDDYSQNDPMYAPGGAFGLDLKGGQTFGFEMLDSCDFECEFDES